MSTWLSEKEFLQSGADSAGVTINVAFLSEIKEDFGFRNLLNQVSRRLRPPTSESAVSPQVAAEILSELRDELETYFVLEEFYGYFGLATADNPKVSQEAAQLKLGHETLYLEFCAVVELAHQVAYRESGPEVTVDDVAREFVEFCGNLADHEQAEMDLMMRLCNEDIGVGD